MLSDLTSGVGRRRVLAVVSVLVLIMASFATMGVADHSQERDDLDAHCPDHQTSPKDDNPQGGDVNSLEVDGQTIWLHYSDDLKSVEFFADEAGTQSITVEFCIKAGDKAGGKEIGDEGHVSWENRGGQIPEISYVVVYRIVDDGDGCPANLELTPGEATNQLGDTHQVTATVTDGAGGACAEIEVLFEVTGAHQTTGTATTNDDGHAHFEYTGEEAGTDTITACTTDEGEAPAACDTTEHIHDTATKHWVEGEDGCPADLTLTPDDATNTVGDTHQVTATVTDGAGGACAEIEVLFEVTGAHQTTGTATTNDDGHAHFEYTGEEAGTDTITACTTDEGEAPESCDDTEATVQGTATKHWVDDDVEAFCRARLVSLFDAEFVLFEANAPGEPCVTEDGSLLNEGQVRLLRAETDKDDNNSATAEVLGLGGQEGDPGGISLLGARTDCDNQEAYLLLITDGDGEDVLRIAGEDNPLPNLAMDDENGIFFTDTDEEEGKAQVLALRLQGTELVVVSEAETRC